MQITDISSHAAIHILMEPHQAAETITAYRNLVSSEQQTEFFGLVAMNLAAFWAQSLASIAEPARTQIMTQLSRAKNSLPSLTEERP